MSAVLRDRLPTPRVPADLARLAAITMTPSDRANRKRIPALTERAIPGPAEYTASASEPERVLAETLGGSPEPVIRASTARYVLRGAVQSLLLLAALCATAVVLEDGFRWVFEANGRVAAYMPSTVCATTMFVGRSALLILLERVLVGRWNPAWNLVMQTGSSFGIETLARLNCSASLIRSNCQPRRDETSDSDRCRTSGSLGIRYAPTIARSRLPS